MGLPKRQQQARSRSDQDYARIRAIDGTHPLRNAALGTCIDYRARARKNGKVAYFNFELAKEMGLIPSNHPHKITKALSNALLDTFAIQIINEYDIINKTRIPKAEIKPNKYMATRYLQLQHPNKTGVTSGDGRSIWNGCTRYRGTTWDISSCGTGATCLSPATAINQKFYRTGDPSVSYGCGYAELSEGIGNAIFSEVFHRNNIPTERTLLVIEFPRGLAINVRAGKNLIRPSHFFNHLKQENYERLKGVADYFIDRQIKNKVFDEKRCQKRPYQYLLNYICETFADICAKFENDYVFCWLDWDGDNILADGGIIDYGSIRQFGLFHHEYRFDDVERWSTTITEQKNKARYIVQTFAQMVDFLESKTKKPLSKFRKSAIINRFNRRFEEKKREYFLERIGFDKKHISLLIENAQRLIDRFEKDFAYFERATSTQGQVRLEDGITKNAIFCMRDILRELPIHLSKNELCPLSNEEFLETIRSNYATTADLHLTSARCRKIRSFQKNYITLVKKLAQISKSPIEKLLEDIIDRATIINRYERITGDSIIHIATRLIRDRNKLSSDQMQHLIEEFIEHQVLIPEKRTKPLEPKTKTKNATTTKKILHNIIQIVKTYREGL